MKYEIFLVVAGAVAFSLIAPPPEPPAAPGIPCGFALDQARTEALADAAYSEVEMAVLALADEGRWTEALTRVDTFPEAWRSTRAAMLLDKLRLRIERRVR